MFVFTIRDAKAEAYSPPFFDPAKGSAIRSFQELVKDKNSLPGKYPEDYSLFLLGEWNPTSAQFSLLPAPLHLADALEFNRKDISNG